MKSLIASTLLTLVACQPVWAGNGSNPPSGAPQPAANTAAPQLDEHQREDVERHRAMARAHEQAAQCLAAGKGYEECQKQLQTNCKGLALGKNCGMRHSH